MKFGCSICISSILKIWFVEVRISRSVSEGPFNFEITRVDCISQIIFRWSGRARVLCNFQCRGVLLHVMWIIVGQGLQCCSRFGLGSSGFLSFTLRLWEAARYRLKYWLKRSFNQNQLASKQPKQYCTNHYTVKKSVDYTVKNQLPVHFPFFSWASACRTFLEINGRVLLTDNTRKYLYGYMTKWPKAIHVFLLPYCAWFLKMFTGARKKNGKWTGSWLPVFFP